MRDEKKLMDDMLALGGNILGNLLAARHEVKAQVGQRAETLAQKLNLVSRTEFEAAFAMLAKARAMQEDLGGRLARIESHLNLTTSKTKVKTATSRLPSVKKETKRGKA